MAPTQRRSPDLTPQTFSCGDTSNTKFTSTVRGTLISSKRISGMKWQQSELQITIEQLLLEGGHSMMEADAVHSSLEAYFNPPIYAPSDYVSRMRKSRNHHSYNVHSMDYTFFLNYENVQGNR